MNGRKNSAAARMAFLQRAGQTFIETKFKKPDENRHCAAMADDHYSAPYHLPFTVYRKGDEWFHSKSHNKIEVAIVKWRYA